MGEVNFPNGWAMATLGELADETVDRSGPASNEFIYVDISSVDREKKCISDAKIIESTAAPNRAKQVLQNGDIVISMTRPNLNAVAMVSPEFHGAIGSTGFHILRSKWVKPKFLFYLVQTREFIDEMCLCVQGALYPAVRPKDISSFAFFLPSSSSQHRIVAKIEELFSELDKGIENLKTARAQIKVYRQALLKHAFEGKLTAQWRAENKDKLETAAALLKRIQLERAQHYQHQLADWEASGKQGSKLKIPKSLLPLTAEELAELPKLPKLPEGWGWVLIDSLLSLEKKPMATGPFGTLLSKNEHKLSGIPVLGIENIGSGVFVGGNKIFVSELKAKELESFRVEVGDIIISRSGTVGEICKIPEGLGKAFISTNLIRVSLNKNVINQDYFVYLFQGGGSVKQQVKSLCKGSSRVFLNQRILTEIAFPLPSIEEQKQIAAVIDAKFSIVEKLESTIGENLRQTEALRQSILKKAFSGQLVPQDPHDEPASALLTRIKAKKFTQSHSRKIRS